MQLHFVETGFFKLDGGAMFGIVPKRLWNRLNPADANNLCTWSMRCLLIQNGERTILVDTGLGDKQDEKFRSFFEPHGEATLLGSLAALGVAPEAVTDVFLTHLHFDHCGGAVSKRPDGSLVPTFPQATYWTNEVHWRWALEPNERERASFLKENFVPLEKAGRLRFLDVQRDPCEWLPGIRVQFAYGHTEAMMLLHLDVEGQPWAYCADLLPSSFHLGLPYIMAYDVRPLVTLEEKTAFLEQAHREGWNLIFEHDPRTSHGRVTRNERGKYVLSTGQGE